MFNDIKWNQNTIIENVTQKCSSVRYIKDSEEYEVKIWIVWKNNRPIIYGKHVEGSEEVVAFFDRMSHGTWSYFEKNILDIVVGQNEHDIITTYNFMKMRAFIVRWLLKRWSLPIELERSKNGELTNSCFKRIMGMNPRIIGNLISNVEGQIFLSDEDREIIIRQSSLLFMPNSSGVSNAHEAISLYCSLSSFWDKFGLNYFDLQKLPEDVMAKLKLVVSSESDFKSKQSTSNSHKKGKVTFGKNRRAPQTTQVA